MSKGACRLVVPQGAELHKFAFGHPPCCCMVLLLLNGVDDTCLNVLPVCCLQAVTDQEAG